MSWVIDSDMLNPGDLVGYSDESGNEVKGIFIRPCSTDHMIIFVTPETEKEPKPISLTTTIVYLLDKAKSTTKGGCSCGAAHTSCPNFHYKWCDIYTTNKSYFEDDYEF